MHNTNIPAFEMMSTSESIPRIKSNKFHSLRTWLPAICAVAVAGAINVGE